MPERIQLRRTKGWRKPRHVVVVSRPSKWGNPFRVDSLGDRVTRADGSSWKVAPGRARSFAVAQFGLALIDGELSFTIDDIRNDLAGYDLACWCPLDQPCHADVLLELANTPETS
jgi:hypothetical protein